MPHRILTSKKKPKIHMRRVKGADSVVVRGEESLESSWRRIFGIDGLSDCLALIMSAASMGDAGRP